jgi:chromosome partitioning protein
MIVTVSSFKGGVGKTTTAIHIAAYLSTRAPALLVDGDANRSALKWAEAGHLPFKVVDDRSAPRHIRQFENVVIDTQARPSRDDLRALAEGCDVLVIPVTPDALSLNALLLTVEELQAIKADSFRVLLTIVPPFPSRAGDDARDSIKHAGLPLCKAYIRRFVAFQKAALEGVTVDQVKDDPHAVDGWDDYETAGRELTK